MNKGKCTRCKRVVVERVKWQGGLYCEDCRKWIVSKG